MSVMMPFGGKGTGVLRRPRPERTIDVAKAQPWVYSVINPSIRGRWANVWERTPLFHTIQIKKKKDLVISGNTMPNTIVYTQQKGRASLSFKEKFVIRQGQQHA